MEALGEPLRSFHHAGRRGRGSDCRIPRDHALAAGSERASRRGGPASGNPGGGRPAPPPAAGAPGKWEALAGALRSAPSAALRVAKGPAYLRWRYAQHPWFRYEIVPDAPVATVMRVAEGRRIPVAIVAESAARGLDPWTHVLWAVARRAATPVVP